MIFRLPTVAGLLLLLMGCSQASPQPIAAPIPGERPRAVLPTPTGVGKTAGAQAPASDHAKPPNVGELVDRAVNTARGGDLPGAITMLEQAVKLEPNNRVALYFLSLLTQERSREFQRPTNSSFLLQSADAIRRLRAAHPDLHDDEAQLLRVAFYNEACTYAVEGKLDKALAALSDAFDAGFLMVKQIRSDHELDPLRKLPRFQELEQAIEQRAQAQAREGALRRLAQAPSFAFDFELPGLDGRKVALADFKGKITIVDLWGTWCPPCRREIADLVDLYKRYHDKGLEIVGINYEQAEEDDEAKEIIRKFVGEHHIPYPCLIGDQKTQERVPSFQGFPTTLYIDRSGKVRVKVEGFGSEMGLEMEEIVVALLAERPSKGDKTP
ncbi:MAG: redoxin domain-containing protein [Planctomycetaceae bacterium]|nr:redoxin domain-containing protein [Planctomycetaceae bacterium]